MIIHDEHVLCVPRYDIHILVCQLPICSGLVGYGYRTFWSIDIQLFCERQKVAVVHVRVHINIKSINQGKIIIILIYTVYI